jgi:phage tail-like protein
VAHSVVEQRAAYPLAAYNFRVLVDARPLSFAKVSGLQKEHHTLTYRHGLSFIEGAEIVRFSVPGFTPVTLERGSVTGVRFLHEWLAARSPRTMEVNLCDQAGAPALTWRIARAVAVKLSAPTFDAQTNESAIDVLEVMAAGITVVHH